MTRIWMAVAVMVTTLITGCATRVSVATTHREDVSAQARVLAIEARNFEAAAQRQRSDTAQVEAARAVASFHAETEEFARAANRWVSDDNVNTRYERLIDAWVKVQKSLPDLKADDLTQESYQRVAHEWEQLARATGYANKPYEQKVSQNK